MADNTPAVLKALADQCVKATFFPIGKHATYYPEILKQVAAAGHTIGSPHLVASGSRRKPRPVRARPRTRSRRASAPCKWALGGPTAPFFRFPALQHPPELVTYLGERNIAIFSTDMDSFDFKMRKPEQVVKSVMTKLKKHGKGIVLMHDFQQATAEACRSCSTELKAGGYKIVHMKPKYAGARRCRSTTKMISKEAKLPTVDAETADCRASCARSTR